MVGPLTKGIVTSVLFFGVLEADVDAVASEVVAVPRGILGLGGDFFESLNPAQIQTHNLLSFCLLFQSYSQYLQMLSSHGTWAHMAVAGGRHACRMQVITVSIMAAASKF